MHCFNCEKKLAIYTLWDVPPHLKYEHTLPGKTGKLIKPV